MDINEYSMINDKDLSLDIKSIFDMKISSQTTKPQYDQILHLALLRFCCFLTQIELFVLDSNNY